MCKDVQKTHARPYFPCILLGLFALLATAPMGPPRPSPMGRRRLSRPPRGVQPLDRLLPGIRRAHPGDFYDADGPTSGPDGDPHYHLKWMTPDGRIDWLDTDARTGRVLGASPGRDSFDRPGPRRRYFAPAPSYPAFRSRLFGYGPRYAAAAVSRRRPSAAMGGGGGVARH